jgi:hypothetical protein
MRDTGQSAMIRPCTVGGRIPHQHGSEILMDFNCFRCSLKLLTQLYSAY